MSKLFFKGRLDKREDYQNHGYSTKNKVKPGSQKNPLTLVVTSELRKTEVEAILEEELLIASIAVNSEENAKEDISELTVLLDTPDTIHFEKTPNRNEPCSCGSGKKYKKCCG